MIANLLEKNIAKVLVVILISPGSRHTRKELKEKTEMNNVPLDFALNKLLHLGIVRKEKNLISLAPESSSKELLESMRKEYVELNLPIKVYHIILDLSNKLSDIPGISRIYLFGSYAKLIYHEKSDIDIAIIFKNSIKNRYKLEKKINKVAERLGKLSEKKVETHFFQEKDLKEKDPLIKDILRNGKRLM